MLMKFPTFPPSDSQNRKKLSNAHMVRNMNESLYSIVLYIYVVYANTESKKFVLQKIFRHSPAPPGSYAIIL